MKTKKNNSSYLPSVGLSIILLVVSVVIVDVFASDDPPGAEDSEECLMSLKERCRFEIRACTSSCIKAKSDSDLPGVWGGDFLTCMYGCLTEDCGGNPTSKDK